MYKTWIKQIRNDIVGKYLRGVLVDYFINNLPKPCSETDILTMDLVDLIELALNGKVISKDKEAWGRFWCLQQFEKIEIPLSGHK